MWRELKGVEEEKKEGLKKMYRSEGFGGVSGESNGGYPGIGDNVSWVIQ